MATLKSVTVSFKGNRWLDGPHKGSIEATIGGTWEVGEGDGAFEEVTEAAFLLCKKEVAKQVKGVFAALAAPAPQQPP